MAALRLHFDHPREYGAVAGRTPVQFWVAADSPFQEVALEMGGGAVALVAESRLDVARAFPALPHVAGYRGVADLPQGPGVELVLRVDGRVVARRVFAVGPAPGAVPPVALLVVGSPWCGAEALGARLGDHPHVFVGVSRPAPPGPGPEDPASAETRGALRLAGFASQPLRVELLADHLHRAGEAQAAVVRAPGARVLVVLRDPVARAFAAWCDRLGWVPPPPAFAAVLALEAGRERRREAPPPGTSGMPELLAPGRYDEHLAVWKALFPGRVEVLVREELEAGLDPVVARVLAAAGELAPLPGPARTFPADPLPPGRMLSGAVRLATRLGFGAGAGWSAYRYLDSDTLGFLGGTLAAARAAVERGLGRPPPWPKIQTRSESAQVK